MSAPIPFVRVARRCLAALPGWSPVLPLPLVPRLGPCPQALPCAGRCSASLGPALCRSVAVFQWIARLSREGQ